MAPLIEGRVFDRLKQFESLSRDQQDETNACEEYLTEKKDKVFGYHHASLTRKVLSVRGKQLVDEVETWLKSKEADEDEEVAVDRLLRKDHARGIVDAMVLSGFLTLNKDNEKNPQSAPTEFSRDNELLIPVAKAVTEIKTTTVWSVCDGAIHAGWMKRKAGLFAMLTQGKDAYVVVNEKLKTLFVFESDLARQSIAEFEGLEGTFTSFDAAHFVHGVRIWDAQQEELLNAKTKVEQEQFMHALTDIGITYQEDAHEVIATNKSFYELTDRDIDGNEVPMKAFKGKVLILVNVACNCSFTQSNYTELVEIDEKYRDRGLQILAFPCNQFGTQEPGSPEEIRAFVKDLKCTFPIFEKADVNGSHARPVFAYLKAKLPGSYGNYVKWNFTKFLVDRNGNPMKRFGPHESPLSFEGDIVELLDREALVEEKVATEPEAHNEQEEVVTQPVRTVKNDGPTTDVVEETSHKTASFVGYGQQQTAAAGAS